MAATLWDRSLRRLASLCPACYLLRTAFSPWLTAWPTMPQYSIIIPAYNEGSRLGPTLDRALSHIASQQWDAEVVVVNDGSNDQTAHLVRQYAAKTPVIRLIENPGNRGKGYSVRNGMLNAEGQVLLFTDADLSAPIEEAR